MLADRWRGSKIDDYYFLFFQVYGERGIRHYGGVIVPCNLQGNTGTRNSRPGR